jgi:hypothetical protein
MGLQKILRYYITSTIEKTESLPSYHDALHKTQDGSLFSHVEPHSISGSPLRFDPIERNIGRPTSKYVIFTPPHHLLTSHINHRNSVDVF